MTERDGSKPAVIKNCHIVSKGGHKMNRRLLSGLVLAATALAPIGTMGTATTAVALIASPVPTQVGRGQAQGWSGISFTLVADV